jgi:hypothetical protein
MSQQYEQKSQIISIWTSDKTCLVLEDATDFDDPKIRFAIIPANGNTDGPCSFYVNVHDARALFGQMITGQLIGPAARHNKKNDKELGFDLYAKMENGHRSLTIKNKNDGVGIRIINNNGEKARQVAYLSAFKTIVFAKAGLAYIEDLDATKLARVQ